MEAGGDLVDQHAGRRLRPGPGLDDHRDRRPPGERGRHAQGVLHQGVAVGEAGLGGLEPGQPPPQQADRGDGVVERIEPQGEGDPLDRPGHQRQQHTGDDAERALAADQEAGEVVAGGVLGQAGEAPHHAAVGQHRLEPATPGPHGPVAHDVDAARVRGDHPADGGAAPGGEVDAHLEARGPRPRPGRASSVTPAPTSTWPASP